MFKGVVITGTSGSGKSTLAQWLRKRRQEFRVVPAITTRTKRTGDDSGHYKYLTREAFEALSDELFVSVKYRGHRYGIVKKELTEIEERGQVPVIVVAPESFRNRPDLCVPKAWEDPSPKYLSLFLDANDHELDRRLSLREPREGTGNLLRERETDRSFSATCLYRVSNATTEDVGLLVEEILAEQRGGGVLAARMIHRFLGCELLLEGADAARVSGASYDLSLGDQYYYGGRIHTLSESEPFLLVEPYDYAIVTSREVANLPADVSARFDLSVGLFCQGIILSNGPQVDPGFHGPLFCLLFNTSSSPVRLKRGQHYATLEFHWLGNVTYPYQGAYQKQKLLGYLPSNVAQGAISDLKKELEEVRRESRKLQDVTWAVLSLIIALIALFLALG